jgi:antitoxin component of MazEF toxin-antitoxin module
MGMIHMILRRYNETLRIAPPPHIIKAMGLEPGDSVLWIPEDDGSVRLKFVKKEKLTELAEMEPAAELEPAE